MPRKLTSMRLSPYALQLVRDAARGSGMSEGQVLELCVASTIDEVAQAAFRSALTAAPPSRDEQVRFDRALRELRAQVNADTTFRERPDAHGPRHTRKLPGSTSSSAHTAP
jgi:hypothetical protein